MVQYIYFCNIIRVSRIFVRICRRATVLYLKCQTWDGVTTECKTVVVYEHVCVYACMRICYVHKVTICKTMQDDCELYCFLNEES